MPSPRRQKRAIAGHQPVVIDEDSQRPKPASNCEDVIADRGAEKENVIAKNTIDQCDHARHEVSVNGSGDRPRTGDRVDRLSGSGASGDRPDGSGGRLVPAPSTAIKTEASMIFDKASPLMESKVAAEVREWRKDDVVLAGSAEVSDLRKEQGSEIEHDRKNEDGDQDAAKTEEKVNVSINAVNAARLTTQSAGNPALSANRDSATFIRGSATSVRTDATLIRGSTGNASVGNASRGQASIGNASVRTSASNSTISHASTQINRLSAQSAQAGAGRGRTVSSVSSSRSVRKKQRTVVSSFMEAAADRAAALADLEAASVNSSSGNNYTNGDTNILQVPTILPPQLQANPGPSNGVMGFAQQIAVVQNRGRSNSGESDTVSNISQQQAIPMAMQPMPMVMPEQMLAQQTLPQMQQMGIPQMQQPDAIPQMPMGMHSSFPQPALAGNVSAQQHAVNPKTNHFFGSPIPNGNSINQNGVGGTTNVPVNLPPKTDSAMSQETINTPMYSGGRGQNPVSINETPDAAHSANGDHLGQSGASIAMSNAMSNNSMSFSPQAYQMGFSPQSHAVGFSPQAGFSPHAISGFSPQPGSGFSPRQVEVDFLGISPQHGMTSYQGVSGLPMTPQPGQQILPNQANGGHQGLGFNFPAQYQQQEQNFLTSPQSNLQFSPPQSAWQQQQQFTQSPMPQPIGISSAPAMVSVNGNLPILPQPMAVPMAHTLAQQQIQCQAPLANADSVSQAEDRQLDRSFTGFAARTAVGHAQVNAAIFESKQAAAATIARELNLDLSACLESLCGSQPPSERGMSPGGVSGVSPRQATPRHVEVSPGFSPSGNDSSAGSSPRDAGMNVGSPGSPEIFMEADTSDSSLCGGKASNDDSRKVKSISHGVVDASSVQSLKQTAANLKENLTSRFEFLSPLRIFSKRKDSNDVTVSEREEGPINNYVHGTDSSGSNIPNTNSDCKKRPLLLGVSSQKKPGIGNFASLRKGSGSYQPANRGIPSSPGARFLSPRGGLSHRTLRKQSLLKDPEGASPIRKLRAGSLAAGMGAGNHHNLGSARDGYDDGNGRGFSEDDFFKSEFYKQAHGVVDMSDRGRAANPNPNSNLVNNPDHNANHSSNRNHASPSQPVGIHSNRWGASPSRVARSMLRATPPSTPERETKHTNNVISPISPNNNMNHSNNHSNDQNRSNMIHTNHINNIMNVNNNILNTANVVNTPHNVLSNNRMNVPSSNMISANNLNSNMTANNMNMMNNANNISAGGNTTNINNLNNTSSNINTSLGVLPLGAVAPCRQLVRNLSSAGFSVLKGDETAKNPSKLLHEEETQKRERRGNEALERLRNQSAKNSRRNSVISVRSEAAEACDSNHSGHSRRTSVSSSTGGGVGFDNESDAGRILGSTGGLTKRETGGNDIPGADSKAIVLVPSGNGNAASRGRQIESSGPDRIENKQIPKKDARPSNSLMEEFRAKKMLILYTVVFFIASILNTIFFKKLTNVFTNYSWFTSNLTTAVYIPVFGVLAYYEVKQERQLLEKNRTEAIARKREKEQKERDRVQARQDRLNEIGREEIEKIQRKNRDREILESKKALVNQKVLRGADGNQYASPAPTLPRGIAENRENVNSKKRHLERRVSWSQGETQIENGNDPGQVKPSSKTTEKVKSIHDNDVHNANGKPTKQPLAEIHEYNVTPTKFPLQKAAVMGMLDSLAGICMVLGGVYTAGNTQVLLMQASIPITLLFSVLLLQKKYSMFQYSGAMTIILAVIISRLQPDGASDTSGGGNKVVFNVIFAMSTFPAALSGIYKEFAFKDCPNLGINLVQYWVAVFQMLVGMLCFPIYAMSVLGPQQLPIREMPESLWQGALCLAGIDSYIAPDCDDGSGQGEGEFFKNLKPCDDCYQSWIPTFIYFVCNVVYNMTTMLLVKHGSASYFFIINAVKLPVTTFLFSSTLIMGHSATTIHWTDWAALFTLMIGLLMYKYGGQLKKYSAKSARADSDLANPLLQPDDRDKGSAQTTTAPPKERQFPLYTIGPAGASVLEPVVQMEYKNWVKTPDIIRASYMRSLGVLSSPGQPGHSPGERRRLSSIDL